MRTTLAEARLADLKEAIEDMRFQRDHWQTMAQRLAITDQRPTPAVAGAANAIASAMVEGAWSGSGG